MKIYICKSCGNIITKVNDSSVPVVCCGKMMEELVAGSVDAAQEKHVPVFTVEDNKVFVFVGDVEHPMQPEHYIQWIAIETENVRRVCEKKGIPMIHISTDFTPGDEGQIRTRLQAFVEMVRGIDSSSIVTSLCDKGLIAERGFLDAPGRPLLFGTTETFLRCFGLESIRDLPEASPVPEQLTLPEELPVEAASEETSPEEVTQA